MKTSQQFDNGRHVRSKFGRRGPDSGGEAGSGFGPGFAPGSGPGFGTGTGEGHGHGHGESRDHRHGHGGESEHRRGGGRRGRARRGDVRAAILLALAEEPMHGYQIMQGLEERTGGAWRPSPGSVYPTLQLLEDQGLVKGEESGGRRVFTLTEAGSAEVAAIKQRPGDAPWGSDEAREDPRYQLRGAVFQLGAAVKQVSRAGSSDQVTSTLDILREARKRVYSLLAETD